MLLVEFEHQISFETSSSVRALLRRLRQARISGVVEYLPSYCSLGVIYDPTTVKVERLQDELELQALHTDSGECLPRSRQFEIPVLYGSEWGPDLNSVAKYHGIEPEAVVKLHSSAEYCVHLIGFTPGFPYLGGLPKKIATPRLDRPRALVPAGSVAIADQQAGIYPVQSPGGWRILGRTPIRLFDVDSERPCLLQIGDSVRFRAVSQTEFDRLSASQNEASSIAKSSRKADLGDSPCSAKKAPVLRVIQPGLLSTLQDMGRRGYQSFGVSPGGAMDTLSLRLANLLLENETSSLSLEITLSGLELEALSSCQVAIAGADLSATVRGVRVPMGQGLELRSGDRLSFSKRVRGARAYLAIRGGFCGESVLGSESTDLRQGWGGMEGRALKKGDYLFRKLRDSSFGVPSRALGIGPAVMRHYADPFTLRVVEGPQWNYLSGIVAKRFFESEFQIRSSSNRMAYTLAGPSISTVRKELVSEPLSMGSLQVFPNGELALAMADHQTIGGYPKIAVVISADFPKAAQLMPGHRIRFVTVSLKDAHRALLDQEGDLLHSIFDIR